MLIGRNKEGTVFQKHSLKKNLYSKKSFSVHSQRGKVYTQTPWNLSPV